jgi:hypothetical protein
LCIAGERECDIGFPITAQNFVLALIGGILFMISPEVTFKGVILYQAVGCEIKKKRTG